jgi:hypothetical protein
MLETIVKVAIIVVLWSAAIYFYLGPWFYGTIFEQLADTGSIDLGRPIAGLLEAPNA